MSVAAENIIRKFNQIKTLPHVVTKLTSLINDDESTMKDFEEVIKMDPTLIVRLLRLVNSPYYGLAQPVDSIARAVAFIGMKNLYNLAVTDALKNLFTSGSQNEGVFSRKQLWMHCAAVSICSKVIAERIFGVNGDDVYLCGILHDFGLIVEEQIMNKEFLAACEDCDTCGNIDEFERVYLNTDHCEIGYLMTSEWDMPVTIQEAIRDHHKQSEDIEPGSLTGIIQISEYITSQLGFSVMTGTQPELSPPLVDHVKSNMDEYKILLEDLPEEMEKAKDLYGSN